ncbi:CAAX prenyl protease 1 [Ceratocystis platani]|uniref:Ste24 endopeptidase n=1 Tax=Ceratocystis fimbriata f. sp. platani TaxID=88771 RepID=A0A0F8DJW7_CERFI|nr:CAAX prenyl protease 1 [Ceratocystis platani]
MLDFLKRLAAALDRPLFPWKKLVLGFSIGQFALETFLSLRQHSVLKHTKPPKVLAHEVTQEVYDKSQAYGRAKSTFGMINNLWGQIQNIAFIQYDVLPKLWDFSSLFVAAFVPARFAGEISQSIVFVIGFIVIQQVLGLPSRIYSTFVLEEKFGFNKQTPKLFVTDIIKTNLLTVAFVPPILAGFLAIIQKTGDKFFFYLSLFTAGLQVFMITVYPIVILPMFNKLSPLEEGELKNEVEGLSKKLGFPLHELFVIDGSKRSAHSNAYFYGLPWKKHIVLYDTLLEKSTNSEVVAVLAHELGHYKLGHTMSSAIIGQVHLFCIYTLFSVFVHNTSLFNAFGFYAQKPIIIAFLLFSDVLSPTDAIMKLYMNIMSRKFEYQADAFAADLGFSNELAQSLIKLQIQNLSTMEADWMYSSYHYSHPILSERLAALNWQPTGKVLVDKEEKKDLDTATTTGRDELNRRAFSVLSPLRPGLQIRSSPIAAFSPKPAAGATTAVADVVPTEAISASPALAMMQIRCGPRNTLNSNSRLKRKRRLGFLARKRSQTGRKILERRLAKGRMRLTN